MAGLPIFSYLADGKLFLVRPNSQPEPIESQFVRGIEDRRAQERERNAFRAKGMMWNFNQAPPGIDPGMLGQMQGDGRPVQFTAMSRGAADHEMYYALQTEAVGGLFLLDTKENYERRLVHRQGLDVRDLARNGETGELACSLRTPEGAAHLGVMNAEGGGLREVTGGDSVDEAPAWLPSRKRTLVYQSAGIGREENGAIFGLGPYAVCQLDLESGALTTLISHEAFDCLSPRTGPDGSLYFIRRPYQLRPGASPLKLGLDVVLFPFRMARALVHFCNAFSMMFARKPLLTAGGPKREGPDKRAMMLWGRWVEVDKKLRYAKPEADPPMVPSDWHLVRRAPDGGESELANHVIAFDVAASGDVLYTNGSAVYALAEGQPPRRVARARFVERVSALS